jgi:cell division protein FtsB
MKKYAYLLKNKYFLTGLFFVVWVLFFDRNDLFSQLSYRRQLRKLKSDKTYYLEQIAQNKVDMKELMSDPVHLEKYAREHYMMKKDNEEIFLIIPDSAEGKTEYKE